ncbi:MAG TPA: selenide, water dikinase SelD [Phnomibacter sp.]|nr:selenide, water dikinase SelD [Phnomibacter sp.]
MNEPIKLTAFSHGAGCGCKIAPAVLDQILKSNHVTTAFPQLLVGTGSKDDAAVYDIGNGQCIVSTTDFFMPIVNDAFNFGRIAGANSISDVYAMGGTPIMAIAVLGWPVNKLSPELAAQVLAGGRAVCAEANIPLAGGHSIDSPEPFFGLAVTGMVTKDKLKQNSTAQAGDHIFLTKPLGVGVLSTTSKRGTLQPEHEAEMLRWLTTLNSIGKELADIEGVHAMTDVTGFGLFGHLLEMCEGSGLSATVQYNSIPIIDGVKEYILQDMVPGSTARNWNGYSHKIAIDESIDTTEVYKLLSDPQTNGGIMVAVAPDAVHNVVQLLLQKGLDAMATPIGRFGQLQEKAIKVE